MDNILKFVKKQVSSEDNTEKVLDNVVEKLNESFAHFDWVGIYLVKDGRLELGPYRGKPSPHEIIEASDGICGAAFREKSTIVVDDVMADPRYLACSINTKSEIVVPLISEGEVVGEIDIDSHTPAAFTKRDSDLLEAVAELLAERLKQPAQLPS